MQNYLFLLSEPALAILVSKQDYGLVAPLTTSAHTPTQTLGSLETSNFCADLITSDCAVQE